MRIITILFLVIIIGLGCKTRSNIQQTTTEPSCKVIINFGSRGAGIDHNKYEKLSGLLMDRNLKYTERSWGKEGEKEICIPLTELDGKKKTDLIDQLKTFEDKSTLVSLSIN